MDQKAEARSVPTSMWISRSTSLFARSLSISVLSTSTRKTRVTDRERTSPVQTLHSRTRLRAGEEVRHGDRDRYQSKGLGGRRPRSRGGLRRARDRARFERHVRRRELPGAAGGEALFGAGPGGAWRRRGGLRAALRDHPRDRAGMRLDRAGLLDALAPAAAAHLAVPPRFATARRAAAAAHRGGRAGARVEWRLGPGPRGRAHHQARRALPPSQPQ